MDFLVHVGGTATECSWSSGSSAGTDKVTYMPDFGVTIYTSENELFITDDVLQVDVSKLLIPVGNRDYLVTLAENITGVELGGLTDFTLLNVGGKVIVTNENLLNPKALFNGLNTITINVDKPITAAGVNTVDGGNVYQFDIPTQPLIIRDTLIVAKSVASSQEPVALDTPLLIEYGPFQSTPQVEISAAGTVLFKEAGTYRVAIHGQYGAPTGGGEAALRFRSEYNGVASGDVLSATINDAKTSVPLTVSFFVNAEAGDELETFLMRDSSASNKGGLFQEPTALAGWDASPSASIRIERFINT